MKSQSAREVRQRFLPAFLHLGLLVLALVALPACGGGGGAAEPEPPPVFDLGEMSATTPSRVGRTFLNPLGAPAAVSAPDAEGPFAFDSSDLPATAPANGPVQLGIIFTPTGPGEASAILTLRFTSASGIRDQQFEFKAVGEALPWTVTPNPVDFGDVLPGDSLELDVVMRNGSSRSPVTFTSASLPGAAFTLPPDSFPLLVQPGQSATLTLRFTPQTVADHGGILRVGSDDVGGPLDIRLWANASGSGEKVVDLGTQTLTNGETPELTVDVPDDVVSLSFEGTMTESDTVGLLSLTGPGGKVYENTSSTGPVLWLETRRTFSVHIPSSDRSSTQLVSGGGSYRFRLFRVSGPSTTMNVRVILEHRAGSGTTGDVLPLNVFLAPIVPATAATAATDTKLQSVLTQVRQLLQPHNISLGDVAYYDLGDSALNDISQGEEATLFQKSSAAAKTRMNLFFVRRVWGGQVLGLAGSIDGSKRKGDTVTGVVVHYENLAAGTVAMITTHEMGHYLGLWHTVESDGTHDELDDTVECPPSGTSSTCPTAGGGLLMHWQALGGQTITSGQGLVLRGHALLHPAGQLGALRSKPLGPWVPDARTRKELESLPLEWCATHR